MMLTEKELDAILDELDRAERMRRDIAQVKAQAELKAIEQKYVAYYDGAYDAVKKIKAALKERENNADSR